MCRASLGLRLWWPLDFLLSLVQKSNRSVHSDIGSDHLAGVNNPVELRRTHGVELQRGLLERQVMIQGVVRNLGSLVVADHGAERSDQHQGPLHETTDLLEVW